MKFAMVFPGQGSQSVGMFAAYGDSPEARETIALASHVLGQDVGKLVAEGPAEELAKTVNTQPLMVTAGYLAWRVWQANGGPPPAVVAGHSLGEYTALVVAGVIDFADCLPLVRFRAQAMQEAVPQGSGAMAAILGLDDASVIEACKEAAQGEVVEAVNFNAPSQVVIAGHATAVARASEIAKAKGAKRAVLLPVSAPFHSSLLAPAAARLTERLATVKMHPPKIPVLHNYDVAEHATVDGIRAVLARQANHPVRWSETIRSIASRDIKLVAECGPGKILAPMVKRTVEGVNGVALVDRGSIVETVAVARSAT